MRKGDAVRRRRCRGHELQGVRRREEERIRVAGQFQRRRNSGHKACNDDGRQVMRWQRGHSDGEPITYSPHGLRRVCGDGDTSAMVPAARDTGEGGPRRARGQGRGAQGGCEAEAWHAARARELDWAAEEVDNDTLCRRGHETQQQATENPLHVREPAATIHTVHCRLHRASTEGRTKQSVVKPRELGSPAPGSLQEECSTSEVEEQSQYLSLGIPTEENGLRLPGCRHPGLGALLEKWAGGADCVVLCARYLYHTHTNRALSSTSCGAPIGPVRRDRGSGRATKSGEVGRRIVNDKHCDLFLHLSRHLQRIRTTAASLRT
mmetsp:Transcript_18826/g.44095  ORF Transcript_18826/g.44095 Transcript_18826/m.44095 type:complete len:321 (-) Transcript_18826:779-1741(-)